MLSHLVGWARTVCACIALCGIPYTVAAQEGQRQPAAERGATTLTSVQTLLERPSPQPAATAAQDDQSAQGRFSRLRDTVAWNWDRTLVAAAAMVGAILLSLPLALIYLRTKPASEFDSSVLFSIVFLAATIAGILVVVQGSLARALSLAGVVSAVRFRSSLKDSNDAVYMLGAISIGLAAGSSELDVGAAISVLLSITLLVLWRVRLDAVKKALLPKDEESRHARHHHDSDSTEPSVAAVTLPAAEGNATAAPPTPERKPQTHARLRCVVLETAHPEQTRLLVEMFFERETKSWRLVDAPSNGNGNRERHKHASGVTNLTYLVRFRKGSQPEAIVERLEDVGQSSHFNVRLETGSEREGQLA